MNCWDAWFYKLCHSTCKRLLGILQLQASLAFAEHLVASVLKAKSKLSIMDIPKAFSKKQYGSLKSCFPSDLFWVGPSQFGSFVSPRLQFVPFYELAIFVIQYCAPLKDNCAVTYHPIGCKPRVPCAWVQGFCLRSMGVVNLTTPITSLTTSIASPLHSHTPSPYTSMWNQFWHHSFPFPPLFYSYQ